MSVNTSYANNGIILYRGEMILLFSEKVSLEFLEQDNNLLKGSRCGKIFLTTHRMIFRNEKRTDPLQSFSFPFVAMDLKQLVFGENYVVGKVRAEPYGNFVGEAKFKLSFEAAGAMEFGKAMLRTASLALQKCISDKTLNELREEVKEFMKNYYYNGEVELIKKIFRCFLTETDSEPQKAILEFFIKANGPSYVDKTSFMFSPRNNIGTAVEHYLISQVKQQDIYQELLRDPFKYYKEKESLEKILKNLKDSKEENEKREHLKNLIDLLIPEKISTTDKLLELNNLYLSLDLAYPNTIEDVMSYIRSTKNAKKKYAKKIIDSLKDISCGTLIDSDIKNSSNLKYVRSFFSDILYDPSVIDYTKQFISEIYEEKDDDLRWLERAGVLILRVFEILTPEMSEKFNRILNGRINGWTTGYMDTIFTNLIYYIQNRAGIEELPHIDKLAFFKMLVRFVGFYKNLYKALPEHLNMEATLNFITGISNEYRQEASAVSKCIDYLSILALELKEEEIEKGKLKIAGEFEYHLSNEYVKLMIWKIQNPSNPFTLLEKCKETIELKRSSLKRNESRGELEHPKRLKVDEIGCRCRELKERTLILEKTLRKVGIDPATVLDEVNVIQDPSEFDNLPPHQPSNGWHEAPPSAYEQPPVYYGWLPRNNSNFTKVPPNSVFMTDNPAPYPGVGVPPQ